MCDAPSAQQHVTQLVVHRTEQNLLQWLYYRSVLRRSYTHITPQPVSLCCTLIYVLTRGGVKVDIRESFELAKQFFSVS